MKRIISAALALVLALSLAPMAGAAQVRPSPQTFALDGKTVSLTAYNIDGYNYVMLRSLAALLSGTDSRFSVTWREKDRTVVLETGKPYDGGGETVNGPAVLTDKTGKVTNAVKSTQALVIDGKTVQGLTAYAIGGSNYFRLADLKPYLGYGLAYDQGTRTVSITTGPPEGLTLTAAGNYKDVLAGLEAARQRGEDTRKGGGGSAEPTAVEEAAEAETPAATNDSAAGEADFSGTNVQVEGIDEGDVVKTDGKTLFILRGHKLILAQAAGKDTKVLSSVTVGESAEAKEGWRSKDPFELYLSGDRAAVLCQCYESGKDAKGNWQDREYTAVDLYDVSDPARPKAVTTLGQDGWHMGARLKDGTLYLVTNYAVWNYDEQDPHTYVPALYRNGQAEVLPAGDVWLCPETPSTRYVVVTAYDLAAGKTTAARTVLGGGDTLYMSHDSIYVAGSRSEETVSDPRTQSVYTVTDHSSRTVTDLVRFDVADGLSVAANGTVPGGLDDQFSLDEADGYLRLVTTTGGYSYTVYEDKEMGFVNYKWHENEKETNGLYVLDPSLNVVGQVTDLAPGERIYSARFDGDVAYFCTFRNVDPLFAVDLSVPTAPRVLSALKLTGFSDYLHPWADGLLFGAGYEADEDTGRTEGLKLVMFHTADKTNVTVKAAEVTDLDWSEALNNHHAFLISRDKDLIAFPAEDQYVIYGYDEARGFYLRATLDLGDWSWGSRGLYAGDSLYVVGEDAVYVITLEGLDLVKTVKLPVE